MKTFKILVCEDLDKDATFIRLYLDNVQKKFEEIKLEYIIANFSTVIEELNRDHDLLILDFFDGDKLEGDKVLEFNKGRNSIPTIIYTQKSENNQVDYNELKQEFLFLRGYLPKMRRGDNLVEFISTFLHYNGFLEKNYVLYNENDGILKQLISSLGENQFNEIMGKICEKENVKRDVTIYKMTSGLSGAVVFKLRVGDQSYVLKLSKEVDKLRVEHENATKLYHKFPSRIINHIDQSELESSDKSLLGIFIKEVKESKTFFDFIVDEQTSATQITSFLNDLFLLNQSLKTNYDENLNGLSDWSAIFSKIDQYRFSQIQLAYKELHTLISAYSKGINITAIQNLIIDKKHDFLNVTTMLDTSYRKHLVLCHGDLHSKNILVQNLKLPVVIDTGGIGFQYWCIDICRLITNLFLYAFDYETLAYYDIARINMNLEMGRKIIHCEPIEADSPRNSNVITALNWLIDNTPQIYGALFSKFEFQLGLTKEFLQATYRIESLPAEKRTVAAVLAFESMMISNRTVSLG